MMNKVFFGPFGLRAGWRVLLFFCLVFALVFGVASLTAILQLPTTMGGMIRPVPAIVFQLQELAVAGLATLAMAKLVDRQPWSFYGLPAGLAFRRLFWLGTATGLLALTLQLAVMRLLHAFYFGIIGLNASGAIKYAAVWAFVFVLVGFAEELSFRGYLLRALTDGIGFWPAAVVTSLMFARAHVGNHGESKMGILAVFAVGIFLCFTVRRTGNLWWAVGFHAGWDWAQSFLFGVADSGMVAQGHLLNPSIGGDPTLSGGTVGPEGSVLIFATIGVMALVFHRAFPHALYTQREIPAAPEPTLQPEATA